MCMDTPYRQIMSPVMVRYTRGIHVHGYTLQADIPEIMPEIYLR